MIHVIDLFAGGGGFSAGAHMVDGVEVDVAVDVWDKGLATHSMNFPHTHHVRMELGGDLEEFAQEIERFVDPIVKAGDTWHLHGSPPCQSFSAANTKVYGGTSNLDADRKRCDLTRWYLALVRRLSPPSWSMEQVPTAIRYLHRHAEWLWTTPGVTVYPAVFGDEFGAATRRKRMYVGYGWEFAPSITARSVVASNKKGEVVLAKDQERTHKRDERICGMCEVLPGIAAELDREPCDLAVRTSTDRYSAACTGGEKNRPVDFENGEGLRDLTMSCFALLCKASALTIYERVDDAPFTGKPTNHRWRQTARALTTRERASLQGFPESFALQTGTTTVNFADRVGANITDSGVKLTTANLIKCIGNSVCPVIAAAIMSSVRNRAQSSAIERNRACVSQHNDNL